MLPRAPQGPPQRSQVDLARQDSPGFDGQRDLPDHEDAARFASTEPSSTEPGRCQRRTGGGSGSQEPAKRLNWGRHQETTNLEVQTRPCDITWYGHAAFLIETGGLRIILDPYRSPDSRRLRADRRAGRPGGRQPRERPLSQPPRPDRPAVRGGPRARDCRPGGRSSRGIRFEAVHVFETPERLPEDEVTIVHFRAEGLHVVFLGDLGPPARPRRSSPRSAGPTSCSPPRAARRRSTSPRSPPCSTRSAPGSSCRCTTRRRRST